LSLCLPIAAQQSSGANPESPPQQPAPEANKNLKVSWLYGAYIPKDAPLTPLTGSQRFHLYLKQNFTTPGIYLKTSFFVLRDQARGEPPEWEGASGFGKRVASNYGLYAIQNSFSALGNGLMGYEPRYDRCKCEGLGPRTRHALTRNFVTYNRNLAYRPQVPLYVAAFGAGAVSAQWRPNISNWEAAYRAAASQAVFGVMFNWIGEFAPEISRTLRRKKKPASSGLQ
jgi:hypothetical protein